MNPYRGGRYPEEVSCGLRDSDADALIRIPENGRRFCPSHMDVAGIFCCRSGPDMVSLSRLRAIAVIRAEARTAVAWFSLDRSHIAIAHDSGSSNSSSKKSAFYYFSTTFGEIMAGRCLFNIWNRWGSQKESAS